MERKQTIGPNDNKQMMAGDNTIKSILLLKIMKVTSLHLGNVLEVTKLYVPIAFFGMKTLVKTKYSCTQYEIFHSEVLIGSFSCVLLRPRRPRESSGA